MKQKFKAMRTTTRLKRVLEKNNIEVRMDDAERMEIYLFNKQNKTTCVVEGKNWSIVINKCFFITKKYGDKD